MADFDSSDASGVLETHSSENPGVAAIKMKSFTTGQEDVTARWSKCAGRWFPKYVAVHRKEAGNEAERRVFAESVGGSWLF